MKKKRTHKQAATERALLYKEHTAKHYESGIGLDIGHKQDKPSKKKRKTDNNEEQESRKQKRLANGVSYSPIKQRSPSCSSSTRKM